MPLDELTDDQLDARLRELLPASPRSRAWERTQREQLMRFITTGNAGPTPGRTFEQHDRSADAATVPDRPSQTRPIGDAPHPAQQAHRTGRATRSRSGHHAGSARRWKRRATLAATTVLLVAGVAGVFAVARQPAAPDTAAPGEPVLEPPAWYQALAPLLPDGFDHVTVEYSHQSFVRFRLFNPESSKSLHVTVSRRAMSSDQSGFTMTLTEAQAEPWTDPNLEYDISLPDGRQIGLTCVLMPPSPEELCPDHDGDHTDPEMLRQFALALATELSPDQLPPPATELAHVPTATILSTISTPPSARGSIEVEAPHYSNSFVQYNDPTDDDFLLVGTWSGFYPPFPNEISRTQITIDDRRATWQPISGNTIWYVYDSPSNGIDVADEILDRAAQLDAPEAPAEAVQVTAPNFTGDAPRADAPITAFETLDPGERRVVIDSGGVTIVAHYEVAVTAPYCVDLTLDGFTGPACGDQEAWVSGTFGIPSGDRTRKLVGQVVSDSVSSVTTSDGRTITPIHNVWWDVAPIDSPVTYVLHTTGGGSSEPLAAPIE